MEKHNLKVVMFPWLAFGHMIPFHQLATALAKHGVSVLYVSTPRNIERLPKIPPQLSSLFQYVSLPLPAISNSRLPQGAEATVDMEFDEIQYLKIAYDSLRDPFKDQSSGFAPDWIITDCIANWMPEIAQECKVKLIYFSVFNATVQSFIGPPEFLTGEGQKRARPTAESLTRPPHWGGGIFPESVAFKEYEANGFHNGFYEDNASGISDGARYSPILQKCQAIAIRSCREFEGEYIDLYQTLINKPVIPIGLLPPTKPIPNQTDATGPWREVFNWLDQQTPGSVIYVGFGSEYKLTRHEVFEIAYGLEIAQLPFIWALRKPTWATHDSEALPPEFENRTSGKGIVCLGWAPQLEILAHRSVGGSLFHSGWGSIIETLQHGHNLVLLPFIIDQGLNARIMVEKGLGIEVERNKDGSYSRNDIAIALKRAMIGDEAHKIKTEVRKVAEIFSDRKLHEECYIREFVQYLQNNACTK